jgi:hypothetical protein
MIFMMPAYSGLTVQHEVARVSIEESMTLHDEDGNVVAYLLDMIWLKWLTGEPPSVLGEPELDLDSPEGWHTQITGRREPLPSASAKVQVHAAVVAMPGTASNPRLQEMAQELLDEAMGLYEAEGSKTQRLFSEGLCQPGSREKKRRVV